MAKKRPPPVCPYCGKVAQLVKGSVIYPYRVDLHTINLWACEDYPACDSYVGCHPRSRRAMGRMANRELRNWKSRVHDVFDPIWRDAAIKKGARVRAYSWLSRQLKIESDDCHIGLFDVDTCKRVIDICEKHKRLDRAGPIGADAGTTTDSHRYRTRR